MRYCILFILSILNTLTFAQGISVSPSRIFFQAEPGQTTTQAITFTNQSKSPFTFVSRIQDWHRDSIGTKIYYPPGQLTYSNGAWLSLSQSAVTVPAGESQTVNLSIRIPEDINPSELSNSMVFFTQVKEQTKDDLTGLGINVLLEVGVQVYHIPPGLNNGELEFLAFEDRGIATPADDSIRRIAVKIKNTGEINKDAYVRMELTNTETGQEISIQPIPVAMLPGAEQWVTFKLPVELKGHYLAIAILDAGSQYDLKIAEKEIEF